MVSIIKRCIPIRCSQFCQYSGSDRTFNILQISRRKMATKLLDVNTPIISLREVHRFIADCMRAVGTPCNYAAIIAENLMMADYRGHYSHGMNRLSMYINDVEGGLCDCNATPCIVKETDATAWMNANNGLGAVAGKMAMALAIKKAKKSGIGLVVCKGSNHYGIAGIYALQAIKENMIGMSGTNTSPLMAPTRAKDAALGTNPLSVGAPGCNNDSFVLDMATTAVAVGKIEFQMRKKEPLPTGWAMDEKGNVATDASVAYAAKRLLPLGGPEVNSGYKGYGLAMMVEVLSGLLAGAAYGPKVRSWGDTSKMADLGHFFFAIDPNCFAPGFSERTQDLMRHLRCMEPADPCNPVLVPGDPEALHMKAVDQAGGLKYVEDQHKTCEMLAKKLNVKPLGCGC